MRACQKYVAAVARVAGSDYSVVAIHERDKRKFKRQVKAR